jgi:LL-diaminopimelate aminotransferase
MQHVAMRGLNAYRSGEPPDEIKKVNATYQHRAKVLTNRLQAMRLEYTVPKATFYVWVKCGVDSMEFARKLVDVGVVVTPGVGFGKYGEGYVRFALTRPIEDIEEACDRIAKIRI